MTAAGQGILGWVKRVFGFVRRILALFMKNRGLLLAGGLAYNSLLSVVPLVAIIVVALSLVFEEKEILDVIAYEMQLVAPGLSPTVMGAVGAFLESREVVGSIGLGILLFFGSIAFRMLEDAISIIFRSPDPDAERKFWVSVLIPYVYMLLLGIGLLVLMVLITAVGTVATRPFEAFGRQISLAWAQELLLNGIGYLGLVLAYASVYKVLPVVRISVRRALVGGVVAATLWMLVARLLSYYFANISLVNAIYGSVGTVIIVLLVMEVAAIILLLGAQVIAELERNASAGIPWYARRDMPATLGSQR